MFEFSGFLVYQIRYQIKIEFSFDTKRLEVALWQNVCLKFLSGTGFDKLKSQKIQLDQCILKMSEEQIQLKNALKKIADYLSRRSHSEKELLTKLSKTFPLEIIKKSLKQAKQNNWLENPQELSEKVMEQLNKKNKSWNYIKNYLYEKALPLPSYDREKELIKAENLLKKYGSLKNLAFEKKIKLKQFLGYRGFEKEIADELLE